MSDPFPPDPFSELQARMALALSSPQLPTPIRGNSLPRCSGVRPPWSKGLNVCGILGSVTTRGERPSLTDARAGALADLMQARGPDGAGFFRRDNVLLLHRRLAVRDPGPSGSQPMTSADGRHVLVYNGELYADRELRDELTALSEPAGGFRGASDTETVLAALSTWGPGALERMRGMYALAYVDTREQRLILARDPLGMKPLYWWTDGRELVFASTPAAVLGHPKVPLRPDLEMVSAYLTTIRTALGTRTLFDGVQTLEPGEILEVDLSQERLEPRSSTSWRSAPVGPTVEPEQAAERVREVLTDSLRRHLVADVPVCSLLSGGLDSAVLTALAVDEVGPLATYCSGAADARGGDLEFARRLAHELGTHHTEVPVDAAGFEAGWTELIEHLGQPLSTPNEVAIHALSRRLRADGHVVALSGEGADELFGGYEEALAVAARFEETAPEFLSGGRFQLESSAWVSPAVKGDVLSEDIWQALEEDAFVVQEYDRGFDRCREEAGDRAGPLDAHLRFQRRINLTGLLQRLDTATMLSGVEGRTPFADTSVVELAESLPMPLKFNADAALSARAPSGPGPAVSTLAATGKLVLRRAFADRLPAEILERPKASFPLPFREWIVAEGSQLARSPFACAIFRGPLLERVAADPAACWNYAWPMMNLARWGDRWWG